MTPPLSLPPPSRTRTLGVVVDVLTMDQAVARVVGYLEEAEPGEAEPGEAEPGEAEPTAPCRIVVTPNLDHAVQLRENEQLARAYEAASLILADGMPLVWASKLGHHPLPERVTGSDLTPRVLTAAPKDTRVFLLGGSEEASAAAEQTVRQRYPHLSIVGRLSPPRGFEHDAGWSDRIVQTLLESRAQLVVLGLGAPKQELWAHAHQSRLPGTVLLCVGATIDFLAGTVSRAPRWMQVVGLEWVYRLLGDPGRLVRRYAKDAWYLPSLLWGDLRAREESAKTS